MRKVHLQLSIQQSLQAISAQMEKPLNTGATAQLYQKACGLLDHISYAPITLARVAGTLLVYHLQETEAAELEWFKFQVQQCPDGEEVEELIEFPHRIGTL